MLERLDIESVNHLCFHLHCTEQELCSFYQYPEHWYRHGRIKDKNNKERPIDVPIKRFYRVTKNLQLLLSRIVLPPHLHGGIKEHSPKTNAVVHVGKAAVLKFDLEDFFPRIRPGQVYRMFHDRLGCSPRVARVLKRLVTLNGGLPQGSPTSTTVANLVIVPLADRLNALAVCHRSDYTQFVDDGAISGPAYIERLRPLIEKIIQQEGFRASPKPHKRLTLYWYQEQVVTGRKVNRRLDAPREKLQKTQDAIACLEEQIAHGLEPTESQLRSLRGKIHHLRDLDAKKGLRLEGKLESLLARFLPLSCPASEVSSQRSLQTDSR